MHAVYPIFLLPLSSHQRCQAIHCAAATGQETVCVVLFASPQLQENIISKEKEMTEVSPDVVYFHSKLFTFLSFLSAVSIHKVPTVSYVSRS